ncbi:MAG: ion transporter, partial [Roseibacillus sp.]|nr:ion transporter [Roseibacillus sp.]
LVGMETSAPLMTELGSTIEVLNNIVLYIFVAEILLKMTAAAPKPWRFFYDGWNVVDFLIVAVCFVPFGGGFAPVLRLFRLFRTLRLVSVIPRLQLIVSALLRCLPSMFYVSILLFLVFYIYAVAGTMLFGANDPVHFGGLWTSMLSLFRVVTLEDWPDVMYRQMFGAAVYAGSNQSVEGQTVVPKAQPFLGAFYFVSFVLVGTMIMLNLVIGVIINGMDEAQKEVADRRLHELLSQGGEGDDQIQREARIANLRKKVTELSEELDKLS